MPASESCRARRSRTGDRRTVYTPPQDPAEIVRADGDLERFINDADLFEADPLIKMALIHHQFESIHPFYDGNGRTGRILNVLYLVQGGPARHAGALPQPPHRHAPSPTTTACCKPSVTTTRWEDWVLYMLDAVEQTARTNDRHRPRHQDALLRVQAPHPRRYQLLQPGPDQQPVHAPLHQDRVRQRDLEVSRLTATKYLDALAGGGFLQKHKVGRSNYYINLPLYAILTGQAEMTEDQLEQEALGVAGQCGLCDLVWPGHIAGQGKWRSLRGWPGARRHPGTGRLPAGAAEGTAALGDQHAQATFDGEALITQIQSLPDRQDADVTLVLQQAEALGEAWAV